MVEPIYMASMGGVTIGSVLWNRFGPRKAIKYCVFGAKGVGKSTFHYAAEMSWNRVFQSRIPTTMRGKKYRVQVDMESRSRNPFIISYDVPHHTTYIRPQMMELKPRWIVWMMDVDSWEDDYNWKVIGDISGVMVSKDYKHRTGGKIPVLYWTPWNGWVRKHLFAGSPVDIVTIVLNKIDKLDDDPKGRKEFAEKVLAHYTTESPDSPMNRIRNERKLHFIAASVQNGYYYECNALDQNPIPLKKYIQEVLTSLTN